jgi:hypothetical protein
MKSHALDIVDNPPTVLNPITDVNVDEDELIPSLI